MTFGQTLRYLRDEQGLSRRELSERIGGHIKEREIAYLEADEKDPRRETLDVLADQLGFEVLRAAFPTHLGRIDAGPADRATARYRARAIWLTRDEPTDVDPPAA